MSQETNKYEAPPAPPASASATPDRAQTFRAVEGGGDTRSGSVLMVEAYAALWLILMAWLVWLWRRQAALHDRIAGLERAIDRAVTKVERSENTKKQVKPKPS
jgi:hypothetical protein